MPWQPFSSSIFQCQSNSAWKQVIMVTDECLLEAQEGTWLKHCWWCLCSLNRIFHMLAQQRATPRYEQHLQYRMRIYSVWEEQNFDQKSIDSKLDTADYVISGMCLAKLHAVRTSDSSFVTHSRIFRLPWSFFADFKVSLRHAYGPQPPALSPPPTCNRCQSVR